MGKELFMSCGGIKVVSKCPPAWFTDCHSLTWFRTVRTEIVGNGTYSKFDSAFFFVSNIVPDSKGSAVTEAYSKPYNKRTMFNNIVLVSVSS